ncbi:hypothetical protein Goari_005651 [Gossypium aridum]|uniref:Bulb-type lectin domain-containing protein n=1 Tax=Gossypium aridum TaxID=34290 RepID=A0A7J8YNF8_GOSAI|nr:hypothetical protein [Gossypium aridum]
MEASAILLFCSFLSANLTISTAVDTLNATQLLKDGETIVSANGRFNHQQVPGNLIHNGSTIWRSNTSRPPRNPSATLLDSGNLVVKDENESNDPENFLWQSFDYPCDTLLEGTKLGRNLVTGLDRCLSSWKTPDDPSPSNFTYRLDISGFPELVLRDSSVIRFRPGPWNGIRFSGTPELKPNKFFTVSVVINEKEVYGTYVL